MHVFVLLQFDDVFNAFTTQEEIFNKTLKPICADVLRGFECTVFAYGQTVLKLFHHMFILKCSDLIIYLPLLCSF